MRDFLKELLQRYPMLTPCAEDVQKMVLCLKQGFLSSKKLLICGNGGSASDAGHIVGELLKSFVVKRPIDPLVASALGPAIANELEGALPAISLPDMVAISSAYANDRNPQFAFAQLTYGLGMAGDVLLAISTSGNSENVLLACQVAHAKGMQVLGLTGKSGGKLKALCDHCVCVPEEETFKIQELHLPVYHAICLMLEQALFL